MCTVVILRRPGHDWPVLIAANRDEMSNRPWSAPAEHWPDYPGVVAGRDHVANGSWLGVNPYGVTAAILNRYGTLGPAPDKRSRGELVLEALDHADSCTAADALSALNGQAYRPFNMLIADNRDAYWIANRADSAVTVCPIGDGLHMLTAHDLDDADASARIAEHHPLFQAAPIPDPGAEDWSAWKELLASRRGRPGNRGMREGAMLVESDFGFETGSASLIALPKRMETPPIWLFASGKPDEVPFGPVKLNGALS